MKAWCQQHQITLGQMKYWLRKLGLSQRSPKAKPTWVEVPVVTATPPVFIVGVGNARIEVTNGFDPILLKQIVQTLEKQTEEQAQHIVELSAKLKWYEE